MTKANIIFHGGEVDKELESQVQEFASTFSPLEREAVYVLVDERTGAHYCECHILAEYLIGKGTVDVPLDPDEQPEYRANREVVEDHVAFDKMREDALANRTFSNIVAEYLTTYDSDHPLKIIGGQHRYIAIKDALNGKSVNKHHGVKVYFGLDPEQRLDVQLISNTNIGVSADLFDRMQETLAGPKLRDWCQNVGLLPQGKDFADKRDRGGLITVRMARTFILNYYRGTEINATEFAESDTTPMLCKSGVVDPEWEGLEAKHAHWEKDQGLAEAAKEFVALVDAQRVAFKPSGKSKKPNADFAEKALNYAVMAAWAMTAGILRPNRVRLEKLFDLRNQTGRDPLNAAALARGRHKTDQANYRGLGYRTDAKERGRLVELFHLQGEKGEGITPHYIDVAIRKHHAKLARLDVLAAENKA